MAEEKKESPKAKKGELKGIYEVEFVNDFGSYKKGEIAEYHGSTAKTLEEKKLVKIGKEVKNYKPKTIKE